MFIWTAKINWKKIAFLLGCTLVVCGAMATAALWGARPASAAGPSPKRIRTAEDRVSYLQGWGWLVSPEATLVEELQMPQEFTPEYDSYLELQAGQGFDLTKYAGKRVRRYTYEVLNYPTGESGVTAHLLTCKDTVIGGEILGTGFLHGLEMPEG